MDLDNYYKDIASYAKKCSEKNISPQDFLDELIITDYNNIYKLICIRKQLLDRKEIEQIMPYLRIGYFSSFIDLERISAFAVCFDLSENIDRIDYENRLEKYHIEQPLFQELPELFNEIRKDSSGNPDLELINLNALEQINDSEIFKFNNKYAILDFSLNPEILNWTKNTFKKSNIYIRLNPYKVFEKLPQQRLFESILIPANPNWWKNLKIYSGEKEGASYILENCEPNENPLQYWEYNVKKIRQLDIIAKREDQVLSMMIEEITDVDLYNKIVGKCIHLDTFSPIGTDFETASLNHLDLAINVYYGDKAKERLLSNLANRDKVKVKKSRTHLLRIENIPFKAFLGFALPFFGSKILVSEWIENQFKNEIYDK